MDPIQETYHFCSGYSGLWKDCPKVNPDMVAAANHAVVGAVLLVIIVIGVFLVGVAMLMIFSDDN